MMLTYLAVLSVLFIGVKAGARGRPNYDPYIPPGEDYTGPCEGGYKTYSRRDCADSYNELRRENAYAGLSIQQYTWQCDHMYEWLSHAANKTGGGARFTAAQSSWLRGLLDHLIETLQPSVKRSNHGFPLGMRKEYRLATDAERTDYHDAINELKTDPLAGPLGTTNKYDTLASFHHGTVAVGAHGGPGFLPWHRIYLLMYEIALKQKRPGVSLLYWDSTIEQSIATPHLSNLWCPMFMGNGDGDVIEGPFANWDATDGGKLTRTVQNFPNQLTTPADIAAVMSGTTFAGIFGLLESIHNKAHSYVGGQMGDIDFSPNDPLFWMHHAFIDCIWEEFRQNSQTTNLATEYPNAFGQHHPQAWMQPFSNLVSPVRNIHGLSTLITSAYYKCDPRPRCPNCGNSAHLYCDKSDNRCKPFIKSDDCGAGTVFVPAIIYCDQAVYGNQNYGVNGVYLETYGVSYTGRDQAYYFGDYYDYYNKPRSSNPSNYRPTYAGYFPTRQPSYRREQGRYKRQTSREQYRPNAYTADGRPCKIECFAGYDRNQNPNYGSCPTRIYLEEYVEPKPKRRKRPKRGKKPKTNTYQAPYVERSENIYPGPDSSYRAPPVPRQSEYYRVTCPCEFQQYTYCPTYIPGYTKPKGCWYNGQSYAEGSSFPSTDGCNTCTCRGGSVVCTKKLCGCHWSAWSSWQYRPCSKTCGTGGRKYKSRTRTKLPGGPGCPGASIETGYLNCDNPPCGCPPKTHPRYSNYPPWCCVNDVWYQPYQNNQYKSEKIPGGITTINSCPQGQVFKIYAWNSCSCAGTGGCHWSAWSSWQYRPCSTTCDPGRRYRSRTRRKLPGGQGCPGASIETGYVNCDNPPCGCHWSAWDPWQYRSCSKTCGTGRKNRSRTRRKLPGGQGCLGASIETGYVNCDNPPCGCSYNGKVYAEGSSFPSTDGCNTCTCRNGQVVCTRKLCGCSYNGKVYAEGSSFPSTDGCNTCTCRNRQVVCTRKICCHWSAWSSWQYRPCSTTCDPGRRYRSRTRKKLPGGPGCPGASIETGYVKCDNPPCRCPPKNHPRYTNYPPWCCVNTVWYQPYQNNQYKSEKIPDGIATINSCPRGQVFKIYAWNSCRCVIINDGCRYNGQLYAEGSSFPSTDGCNTCTCKSGKVVCTLIACGCAYNNRFYAEGSSFPSTDGCNTCTCKNRTVICTKKDCGCKIPCKYCPYGSDIKPGECCPRCKPSPFLIPPLDRDKVGK